MGTGTKPRGPRTEGEGGEQPAQMGCLERPLQRLLAESAAGWKQHELGSLTASKHPLQEALHMDLLVTENEEFQYQIVLPSAALVKITTFIREDE